MANRPSRRIYCVNGVFGSIERQTAALLKGLEAAVPRHLLLQLAHLVEPGAHALRVGLLRKVRGEEHGEDGGGG